MDLAAFREEFLSEVDVWASADQNYRHSSFVDVGIHYLEEAGEVSDFEPCYFRGVSKRRNVGVDGYSFDRADASVRLFIANPVPPDGETLTQTDAKAHFGKVRAFVEDAMNGRLDEILDENHPARAFADDLRNRGQKIARLRAYLLTDAVLSQKVKDWPEGDVNGIPIEFHIWDISRFFRAYSSRSGQDELVVDLRERPGGGLPCLEASIEGGKYSSYLCVIPGQMLADIYDEYGSRLLEGNVRAFLSTKVKVNKDIRNSVLHRPEMFFAYNNGIAATASSIDVTRNGDGLRIEAITDLQIVNGGQTTASLSAARRTDKATLAQIFVPMKLSVIEPELAEEMIPQISRSANSQNKVSDADFFSNHEIHRRLEAISRRMWAPAKKGAQHETKWFYERARGQYTNAYAAMTPAARRRFMEENPREQLVTKTDLAKSENSWMQLPQKVSRGAQTNFLEFAGKITEQWNSDRERFNEAYFRHAIARVILFKATERLVSAQSWYSGGYRANIVTYTIAKLAHDTAKHSRDELNFMEIWQTQDVPEPVLSQIADIARAVYDSITNPSRGHENVTQWCKKDECWLEVQRLQCPLLPEYLTLLIPPQTARVEEREARALQQMDSGIDAQAAVVQLGPDYWKKFVEWGRQKRLLQASDERIVGMAAGFTGAFPSDRQSKRLLTLKAQFEEEGFPPPPIDNGSIMSDFATPPAMA